MANHISKVSKLFLSSMSILFLSACSVFGDSGVEITPYKVIQKDENIEVRTYEKMVLVTTNMVSDSSDNKAFQKLFDYISGANTSASNIEMTAPVIQDVKQKGEKIEMTAPVFMDATSENEETMSFVLPQRYSYDTAPKPTDESVKLQLIENETFAVIEFSGFMNDEKIENKTQILQKWIIDNGYESTGPSKRAGYNPPWTIPAMRRNEVLIPVAKTK